MRTSQKERKENARRFYNMFINCNCKKAAVVVERPESTNPKYLCLKVIKEALYGQVNSDCQVQYNIW